MRNIVFAMVIGLLVVVAYDHLNAPNPKLTSAPDHLYSENIRYVCAEDMRDDAYQTKITVSAGRLERIDQWYDRFFDGEGPGNNGYGILGDPNERCLMYTAPVVSKETSMQISVWQGNKKTDQAEVTLTPSPF